jgi:hypothetical protein
MKLIELFGKSLLVASAAFALSFSVGCKKADDADPAPPAEEAAPAATEEK